MKKIIVMLPVAMAAILISSPLIASAHEQHVYRIGNKTYQFVVGSLNEPLVVDDKSGLDLTVMQGGGMPTMGPDGDMDGPPAAGVPVQGLEKTLKLEMIAGDQKKTMDITPAWGKPGGYKTTFFPTVQTTFSYRLFGTLNNVPVDLTFTCNPAGHTVTPEDKTETKITDNVTQLSRTGAFGCAEAKADFGFPEAAVSSYDTNSAVAGVSKKADSSSSVGMIGIVLGALGLIAGAGAWMKGRKVS